MPIKNKKMTYRPDYVSPPGETLQETLEAQGLSQAQLAERSGRPKKTINEIIQGKASITPETAHQLELVLGVPASFWLARETKYRAWLAQQTEDARIDQDLEFLNELPIKEMTDHGWIENCTGRRELAKNTLSYFGVVNSTKIPRVEERAFRHYESYASNPWALAAWLRKGELEAKKQLLPQYNKTKFLQNLAQIKKLTRQEPECSIFKIQEYCAEAGVTVIFLPALPGTSVSSATRWINSSRPLIQITLKEQSNDTFWLSFFHTAGHIVQEHAKKETLLETQFQNTLDHLETAANQFALDFLIPQTELKRLQEQNPLNPKGILKFADSLGIAPGIVVGWLQFINRLTNPHPLDSLKQTCFAKNLP